MILLEAKGLNKKYNNQTVLNNIDFSIRKGEMTVVMGPSGSGKSTLLYMVSGMDKPDAGDVFLNGENLMTLNEKQMADKRLKEMGFIFQHMHLLQSLSIMDNIVLPAYFAKEEKRSDINKRAEALMDQTGISPIAGKDISEVSGGELQRAAICRALINRPEILFGDEPTGALNSKATADVMAMLVDINRKGTAIMLVSHDTRVAAYADTIHYMADGVITGALELGKYTEGGHAAREAKIIQWVTGKGF